MLYRVSERGDHLEAIYLDDPDRVEYLDLLGEVCQRFHWAVHAYCLTTNHFHLVIETLQPNLSGGMRQLNGIYTQRFNRRHRRVGHVFQGRYHAVIVQEETHLLELARYVVLSPVRASWSPRSRSGRGAAMAPRLAKCRRRVGSTPTGCSRNLPPHAARRLSATCVMNDGGCWNVRPDTVE